MAAMIVVAGGAAVEPRPDRLIMFRAEPGDTFQGLFGKDWQRAWEQNRMTVIRKGKPLVSPDILVEGAVLPVTDDVYLTPRAAQRVKELVERRVMLRRHLSEVVKKGGALGVRAEELRRMLDDDTRYGADLDYLDREVNRLRPIDVPPPESFKPMPVWAALGVGCLAALLGYLAVRRKRRERPTGDERMTSVLPDLDRTLASLTGPR